MDRIPEYTLSDGTTMPAVGFGTYKLNGADGVGSVLSAIGQGYRLLDSAFSYENEGAVGEAVRQSPVPREELLVTSKLPGRYHAYDKAVATVEESLYRCGLEYLDLYLVHWPNPRQNQYVEAWRALVDLRDRGLIRTPGVCNFLPQHLERAAQETGTMPPVNQVELHPYFPQWKQRAFHDRHGVRTQSWSPLGRASSVLTEPVIERAARDHGRSTAQVILRWHHQLGSVPVPKASGSVRQRENLDLFDFELSQDEMAAISALGREDGRTNDQDPAVYEEF